MIQWIPQQSYWRPVNIMSAQRRGAKFSLGYQYLRMLSFHFNYSYIIARNLSPGFYYDTPLQYSPKHSFSLLSYFSFNNTKMTVNYDYLGKRISTLGYPDPIYLLAAGTFRLSVGRVFSFTEFEVIPNFSIDNIFNLEYETITGYPEPGRSVFISLTVQSKKIILINKKKVIE